MPYILSCRILQVQEILYFNVTLSVAGLTQGTFNIQGLTVVSPTTFIRRIGKLNSTLLELIEVGVNKWLGFK